MVEATLAFVLQVIDEASSTMDKIRGSMGILGSSLAQLGGGFADVGNIMTGFAAGGAVGAVMVGVSEVIKGLQDSVKAAGDAQQAWTMLQTGLKLSGSAWDETKAKIDTYIQSLEKSTTVGSTQAVQALQQLSTFGMNADQAMQALSAAVELSAAKHIDLETAVNLVGKAFIGNSALLQRYGVDVETATKAHAAMKQGTDELAAALQKAGTGSLQPFSKALDDAGISLTGAKGKIEDATKVAGELVKAFEAGKLSSDTFSEIMTKLGVTFDWNKAKASDYQAVLQILNEQYAGAAQAQASTYEGLQEQLGNAWQDISVKIGTLLIPALTDITKGMVPVIDAISQGIDKVGEWIKAVEKMPEVQDAIHTVQNAFSGLQAYMESTAKYAEEKLGPAINNLGDAFGGLKGPINTLIGSFDEATKGAGGLASGFDPLKVIIDIVASGINTVAAAIKLLTPNFQNIASAIHDAIGPWQDLAQALAPLGSAFNELIGALTGAGPSFDAFGAVVGVLAGIIDGLAAGIRGLTAVIEAITPYVAAFSAGVKAAVDIIVAVINAMREAIQAALAAIQSAFDSTIGAMISAANSLWEALVGHSIWTDLMDTMVSQTNDALSQIQDAFTKVLGGLPGLVPSINIQTQLTPPAGLTMPPPGTYVMPMGGRTVDMGAGTSASGGPSRSSTSVNVPVTVQVDGKTVSKILEQRLVERRNLASTYK